MLVEVRVNLTHLPALILTRFANEAIQMALRRCFPAYVLTEKTWAVKGPRFLKIENGKCAVYRILGFKPDMTYDFWNAECDAACEVTAYNNGDHLEAYFAWQMKEAPKKRKKAA